MKEIEINLSELLKLAKINLVTSTEEYKVNLFIDRNCTIKYKTK